MSEIAVWLESYWPVIVILVVVLGWMDYRNRLAATTEEFQLLLDRTHRRHCKTVPRKIFGSSGGSILPTGETPVPGGTRQPPPSKAPPASRAHPRFNGSDGLLCRRIDRNARRVP